MKNLQIALTCLILIVIIVAISAIPLGVHVTEETVNTISKSKVLQMRQPEIPQPSETNIPVHTITITNKYIPRQYALPLATACLYNSQTKKTQHLGTQWQTGERIPTLFGPSEHVVRLGRETKTATLMLNALVIWKEQDYDSVLLFFDEDYRSRPCYNLQEQDIQDAKHIPLV